jgi:hypothetical protein
VTASSFGKMPTTLVSRLTHCRSRQARELGISRGSVYYLPRPASSADLAIMRRIGELHMSYPFTGSRMLRDLRGREGIRAGQLHDEEDRNRSGQPTWRAAPSISSLSSIGSADAC